MPRSRQAPDGRWSCVHTDLASLALPTGAIFYLYSRSTLHCSLSINSMWGHEYSQTTVSWRMLNHLWHPLRSQWCSRVFYPSPHPPPKSHEFSSVTPMLSQTLRAVLLHHTLCFVIQCYPVSVTVQAVPRTRAVCGGQGRTYAHHPRWPHNPLPRSPCQDQRCCAGGHCIWQDQGLHQVRLWWVVWLLYVCACWEVMCAVHWILTRPHINVFVMLQKQIAVQINI